MSKIPQIHVLGGTLPFKEVLLPVAPFSTFHPTTHGGQLGVTSVSARSLIPHMQREMRSYGFYLLNLSPTCDFLSDCAIIALAQASAFLTLMTLMTPKSLLTSVTAYSNSPSEYCQSAHFKLSFCHFPGLGPAKAPHRSRIKGHISWQDTEVLDSLDLLQLYLLTLPYKHLMI